MATVSGRLAGGHHTMALYRAGTRADSALRTLTDRATRITVVVLAREEPRRKGCCDTRSVLWNQICRDLANEDLMRAAIALDAREGVEYHLLHVPASDPVSAIASEAIHRGADEIVLADPRGSGLGRLERRRLRRISAVPVVA